MKVSQYREMNNEELLSSLEELERHLFDLKSQSVTEKLEDNKAMRNTRRDIARVKTIIREQQ